LSTQINAQKGIPINHHDKYAYQMGGEEVFGHTKLLAIQVGHDKQALKAEQLAV
jgi:hypothetical protein